MLLYGLSKKLKGESYLSPVSAHRYRLAGNGSLANVIGQFKTNKTSLNPQLVYLLVAELEAGNALQGAYA